MNQRLGRPVGDLAREWAPELRRGLLQVLRARDPAPAAHSRRGRAAVAVATWLGFALLVVAVAGSIRLANHPDEFVSSPPDSLFGGWHPRTLQDAEGLSLLLLVFRYPLLAWRIGYASVLLVPFAAGEARINLPIMTVLLIAYWVAGLRHGRAASWAMWVLMLIPVWLWVRPAFERPLLATAVLLAVAVALDATSASRHAGQALAARVAQSEVEDAHRTVLEERTRIAREMHDVVAHHMSMIAVQAETAPYRLGELPASALDEFASLSGAARDALNDLRRLLGVLRSDAPPQREPQPRLADVAALVEATRRAGVVVELSMPANGSAQVSHAVGLCAYRVVQEALSNAGRHAPGSRVFVTVTRESRTLRLDVVNGPSNAAGPAPAPGGRPGHGIAGMRERVTLLGGAISAGARADGGFAVSATLPLEETTQR